MEQTHFCNNIHVRTPIQEKSEYGDVTTVHTQQMQRCLPIGSARVYLKKEMSTCTFFSILQLFSYNLSLSLSHTCTHILTSDFDAALCPTSSPSTLSPSPSPLPTSQYRLSFSKHSIKHSLFSFSLSASANDLQQKRWRGRRALGEVGREGEEAGREERR